MADFLTIQDLYTRAGQRKVDDYFDDEQNGTVLDNAAAIDEVLSAAEGEMYARLLRAYPGDPSDPGGAMQVLVANDPALKRHVSYFALQFAAERRPAFTDENGEGPWKTQYKRAIEYFEHVSKGTRRSKGETSTSSPCSGSKSVSNSGGTTTMPARWRGG